MTATVSLETWKTPLVNLKSIFGKNDSKKPAILQVFSRLYKGIMAKEPF